MNEAEELAELIWQNTDGSDESAPDVAAARIIAAGWGKVRPAQAAAWAEGAQAGFESTMEGFNGECAFNHCAPDDYPPTNPYSGEKWEVADYKGVDPLDS